MTVVVDTSVLVAVVSGEPDAEAFAAVLASRAGDLLISAATLLEAGMVVEGRHGPEGSANLRELLATLAVAVEPFTLEQAEVAITAWRRFGKGRHPARLNLGDCFSYALARTTGSALLFKGKDFSQTDVPSVV